MQLSLALVLLLNVFEGLANTALKVPRIEDEIFKSLGIMGDRIKADLNASFAPKPKDALYATDPFSPARPYAIDPFSPERMAKGGMFGNMASDYLRFMNMPDKVTKPKSKKSKPTAQSLAQVEETRKDVKTKMTVPAQLRRQLCPNPAITDKYKKEHLQCGVTDLFGKTAPSKFAFSHEVAERDHREVLKYRAALHREHGPDLSKIFASKKFSQDPQELTSQLSSFFELQDKGAPLIDQSGHSEPVMPALSKKQRAGRASSESSSLDEDSRLSDGEVHSELSLHNAMPALPKKTRAGRASSESSSLDDGSPDGDVFQSSLRELEVRAESERSHAAQAVLKKSRAGKASSESSFLDEEELKSEEKVSARATKPLPTVAPKKSRAGKSTSESSLVDEEVLKSETQEVATKKASLPVVAPAKNRPGKASSEASFVDEEVLKSATDEETTKETSVPMVAPTKNRPGKASSDSSFVDEEDLKSAGQTSTVKVKKASAVPHVAPSKSRPGMQHSDSTLLEEEHLMQAKAKPQSMAQEQGFKPVPHAEVADKNVSGHQIGQSLTETSSAQATGNQARKKVTRSKKARAGSKEEGWAPTADNSNSSYMDLKRETEAKLLNKIANQADFISPPPANPAARTPNLSPLEYLYQHEELPNLRARRKFCPNPIISSQYKTEVLNCQMSDLFGIDAESHKYSESVMERDALDIENYKRIMHADIGDTYKRKLIDGAAPPESWQDPSYGFGTVLHIWPGDGNNDDKERRRNGAPRFEGADRYPASGHARYSAHYLARSEWERERLGEMPADAAQAVATSDEIGEILPYLAAPEPEETSYVWPPPIIDTRARQWRLPASEYEAMQHRQAEKENIRQIVPGWGKGWFLQKHDKLGNWEKPVLNFHESPASTQTLAELSNDKSKDNAEGNAEAPAPHRSLLSQALDSEDLTTLQDLIQAELLSRDGEDADIGYAKLAAKRSRARREDNFTAVEIGVLIGVIVLLVIVLIALTKKAQKNETHRYKQGAMTLDSSDLESSETGSTDRELKVRMERFEQRLEEHTRMLEAEEQGSSRGSEDLDPSSCSKRPNWMTKK
eukprot:gnl/MRDRNA2_/MRDRNA2_119290_c0_seq1.p1 gnl/MRDRNA2_/MRDRNA2_119290_c0~~gnl/MRDRNA2_/MRDRNA2_119290_c0_seq1.p1  ORF type:complete len:1077 (-),score=259.21 gnl/MRDRNA2_/MRDRNA2_119290_c0_seq1:37-3267(-)